MFIGGAPRSGTTYVQLLLYSLGRFSTVQETHLFPGFLGHLQDSWDRLEVSSHEHRKVGLPFLLDRAEFDDIMRLFAKRVLREIRRQKPRARYILEKTPGNVLQWRLIARLLPNAWFVTVVRDPRAVVASTVAAREWAGPWSQRSVAQIAEVWVKSVGACLDVEAQRPRVIRVQYERLLADPDGVLIEIARRLGLKITPNGVRRAVERVSMTALKAGAFVAPWPLAEEPEQFYRLGDNTAWRRELSLADIAVIEEIAGETMLRLGYGPALTLAGS